MQTVHSTLPLDTFNEMNYNSELRTVSVTRYVTPLREGGSLPAIVEADDGFLYVMKFRGAGQGPKALIAELIGGEVARILGLKVPELVFIQLDPAYGRSEPDEEIQDLLKASAGLNLGLHYLSGSTPFDPIVNTIDPKVASGIVWLDAYLANVDRTVRNTNMLIWNKELWLIDHGAALYFHHSWDSFISQSDRPFGQIKDHVLLSQAGELRETDALFRKKLTPELIEGIVRLIPDEWMTDMGSTEDAENKRSVYLQFLTTRLYQSEIFTNEAQHARQALI